MPITPQQPKIFADRFGRSISYLRVSITDRCNFRCVYCMPAAGLDYVPRTEILTFEEIATIVKVFASHGVSRIRLTGGEPLVRSGVSSLVARLKTIEGIEGVYLTTNAFLLRRDAVDLKAAGLDGLNVSIDSLRPERFGKITRVGDLDRVLDGIAAAADAGLTNMKLNAVIVRGFNDDEVITLLEFAASRRLVLRFIEFMPMGEDTIWGRDACFSAQEIREVVASRWELEPLATPGLGAGPARYWRLSGDGIPDEGQLFGIIGAVTECFCAGCNRARVTPQGGLRACLADDREVDLRAVLRSGRPEIDRQVQLEALIESSLFQKSERHAFDLEGRSVTGKRMHAIGG